LIPEKGTSSVNTVHGMNQRQSSYPMKLIQKGQSSAERINTKSTVLNQTYHQKIQDGSFGNLNRPICE